METGGHLVDVVTWHYYPQQSGRCIIASRPAEPYLLMEPVNLLKADADLDPFPFSGPAVGGRVQDTRFTGFVLGRRDLDTPKL